MLLDDGKVKAYDVLEKIWQNPLFSPWKTEHEQSAVLFLPVHLHHPVYNMTALSLGEQLLWVNAVAQSIGDKVRVCVHNSDVSLALIMPEKSSIRNILRGKITALFAFDDRVDVQLEVSSQQIWASLSKWSCNELHLTVGQAVYVQINAVSVVK